MYYKFRIGDRVRNLEADDDGDLEIGDIGTVTESYSDMPSVSWDKNVDEEYPQSQDCMELYDGDELSDDESPNDALTDIYNVQHEILHARNLLEAVVNWLDRIQKPKYKRIEIVDICAYCNLVKRTSDDLEYLMNTSLRNLINKCQENEN